MADATVVTTTEYGFKDPSGYIWWNRIYFDGGYSEITSEAGLREHAQRVKRAFDRLNSPVPTGFEYVTRELTVVTSDVKSTRDVTEFLA